MWRDICRSLEQFWRQSLDIRTVGNALKQKLIAEKMPVLWPNLLEILNLENSKFLPDDVSSITIKLIKISRNTFLNAATQTEDEIYGDTLRDM